MAELVEGTWKCKVLGGEANADDKQIMTVRINFEITDGPDKGRRGTYEDQVSTKSAKYIIQSAKAVGWSGTPAAADWRTFRGDVDAWIKSSGGDSTVTVEHVSFKDKKTGEPRIWGKAKAIGRGPKALRPPSKETLDDANEAARRALAEAFGDTGGSSGGNDDVPPPADDDIPFITCSMSADRDPICKVRAW